MLCTQWGNMKEKSGCCQDGVVFAICVNLSCFSVFTERSVPKLQGPTLSKMNNLFSITLLSCYNGLCNILPDFLTDMTGIKVVLLVYFRVTKKLTLTFYFPDIWEEACEALVCGTLMSSNPFQGFQWLSCLVSIWLQGSHSFPCPHIGPSHNLMGWVRLAAGTIGLSYIQNCLNP